MKPEITAPGTYIPASFSSYYTATTGTVANTVLWNDKSYNYGYMEGTSMAAPLVAGIVATWLEAYPQMTPEELRTILESTATNDEFTAPLSAAKTTWGYGKINALEGIKKAIELAKASGIHDATADNALTKSVRSVLFFDLAGRRIAAPTTATAASPRGLFVKKTIYTDGTVESKVVKQ